MIKAAILFWIGTTTPYANVTPYEEPGLICYSADDFTVTAEAFEMAAFLGISPQRTVELAGERCKEIMEPGERL